MTFYKTSKFTDHKSLNKMDSMHQEDRALTDTRLGGHVESSIACGLNCVSSDRYCAATKFEIKDPKKKCKPKLVLSWSKFKENKTRLKFNGKLESIVGSCSGAGYEEYCNHTMMITKDTSREPINPNEGWLELSKDIF